MSLKIITDNYKKELKLGKKILSNLLSDKTNDSFRWIKCTSDDDGNDMFNIGSQMIDRGFTPCSLEIKKLLHMSSKILKNNGFEVDENHYHIDFHRYNLTGKHLKSELYWHKDDFGAVDYPVNTIILYLHKDKEINGGNLLFPYEKMIEIKSNMIVLMSGNLEHKPEDMNGYGKRDSIVIQFRRTS